MTRAGRGVSGSQPCGGGRPRASITPMNARFSQATAPFTLLLALFLFALSGMAEPVSAQEQGMPVHVREFARGGAAGLRVLSAPLRWYAREWALVPLAGAGIAAVSLVADRRVAEFRASHQSESTDDVLSFIEPLGDNGAAYLLAGMYVAGVIAEKPAVRRIAIEGAVSGTISAGIVVVSLKALTGRA